MHFGRPFSLGNTVIHFVEQITGAFYRENIVLDTKVYSKKNILAKIILYLLEKVKLIALNIFLILKK